LRKKINIVHVLPFENLSLETVFVVRDIHIYSNSLMLLKNTRINSAISKIEEAVVLEPQFKGNKTVYYTSFA